MKVLISIIIIFSVYSILFSLIKENTLYDDEPSHFAQIRLFLNKKPVIYSRLSLIPGYHLTIASLATILGTRQISHLRTISFTINLFAIFFFYLVARKLDEFHALTKTIQFSFFPILFPFQFLLYAEGLMLLLTFISFYFAYTKRHTLSAFFGLLSILARQQNIVWVLFINLFCVMRDMKQKNMHVHVLKKYWLFIITYLLFFVFVAINRGIAYGTSDVHPSFTLHPGNVYFALFACFVLFLPLMIANTRKIFSLLASHKRIFVFIAIFIAVSVLTFENSHPWNRYPEHLQNRLVLVPFTSNLPLKMLFFTIVSYSVISLRITKLLSWQYYLLYPFAFLSLAPIWLIVTRYGLVAYSLFLLFRKTTTPRVEWLIILINTFISLYLFYGYLNQIFYL